VLPPVPSDEQMWLETARLSLSPLVGDDAVDLFPVFDDPELGRWTGDAPPPDVATLRSRFASWESRHSPAGDELWLNWAVRRRSDELAVGQVQSTVTDDAASVAWVIGIAFQRQGFATEAASALVAWLTEELGCRTFTASIPPGHLASEGVARRLGLRPTDRHVDGEVIWDSARPLSV